MLRQGTSLGHLCSGSEVEQRGFSRLASAQTIPGSGIIKWVLRPLWQTTPLVLRGHQTPSQLGRAYLGLLTLRWKQEGNVVIHFDQSVHFRETRAWVWGGGGAWPVAAIENMPRMEVTLPDYTHTGRPGTMLIGPGPQGAQITVSCRKEKNHPGRQHKKEQPPPRALPLRFPLHLSTT